MTYPGAIDDFTEKTDEVDDVMAADVNELQAAIENIETELGTDPAGSATDLKTRLAHSINDAGMLEFDAASELTISSGAVTITQNYHILDTESDASSDNLDTINGESAGMFLVVRTSNSARDVVLKHGTGNIRTASGADVTLGNVNTLAVLVYDSGLSAWLAFAGSGGGSGDVLYSKWDPDCPPASAGAIDDEFNDSEIDGDLWTEVDINTDLTVAEGDYGLSLNRAGGDGGDMMGMFAADPTGDLTIVAKMHMGYYVDTAAQTRVGVALVDGLTTDDSGVSFGVYVAAVSANTDAIQRIAVESWSTLGGGVTGVLGASNPPSYYTDNSGILAQSIYFRIRRATATYTFDYSHDGLSWFWVYQTGSLGITPTHIGIFLEGGETLDTLYVDFFRYLADDVGNSVPVAGQKVSVYG